MKRIIFSDIHNCIGDVDRLLDKETFDEAICAGDYFHNFYDDAAKNGRTAEWLLRQTFVKLMGNHDTCHRWPGNPSCECPGWSKDKQNAINSYMSPGDWSTFKLTYYVDGYLISHAGVHPAFSHPVDGMSLSHIAVLEQDAISRADMGIWAHFLAAGADRGFRQNVGGVTWLDWDSLVPIEGINQIVGHTPRPDVRTRRGKNSRNYCIDTNRKFYAVLQDGQVEIKNWPKKSRK